MSTRVSVFAGTNDSPVIVGVLIFDPALRNRAGVSTTFIYDDSWLERKDAYPIDPALPLFGRSTSMSGLPGCFQDCAPDRWGRNLIAKRRRAQSLREPGKSRDITDVDYLLGVADLTRQGALRLRVDLDGPFVDPETSVPKLLELPRLLAAADAIERDPDDQTALKDLLDAGSGSLGGARPKASVKDDQQLLLVKFPHHDDDWDVMAWEATALDLAAASGIDVPGHRLARLTRRTVLILSRFDRTKQGQRVPYISAMTLLDRRDGDASDYVDLCDALVDHGASPDEDLEALWLRVALSVAIHNTDDHMRNHGFLRTRGGWALAPLFDVNPEPNLAKNRVTGIDGARALGDESLGLASLAEECRLTLERRNQLASRIISVLTDWPQVARSNGLASNEVEHFRPVFDAGSAVLDDLIAQH